MKTDYDYVIVGAGSSGCVVANRLSADPRVRVLLVEAGPADSSWLIHMPRGLGRLIGRPQEPHSWFYQASKGEGRPAEQWQKGRTLGGSSSINGMVYVRGHPRDYDRWEEAGCVGWGWGQMKSVFEAMETVRLGNDRIRGDGPLKITIPNRGNRLTEAIIAAAESLGTPRVVDTNDAPDGGVGYTPETIWSGRRQSAAVAFLRPVLSRPNLDVVTDTRAVRILFDGKRAVGVVLRDRSGEHPVAAHRELILSAGSIETPKLLQLSGVGPIDLLRRMDIDVVQDSPDVGQNLREHFLLTNVYRVREGSHNPDYRGAGLLWSLLRYSLTKTGPMASSIAELSLYMRTRAGLDRPNLQVGVGLQSLAPSSRGLAVAPGHGIMLNPYFMHPRSKGSVTIASPSPDTPPIINANYLAEQEDRDVAVAAVKYTRKLMSQPQVRNLVIDEQMPGPGVSDDELLAFYTEAGSTGLHVSCTCRMGADERSVVDPRLRVRGIAGLRVIDTSIMPELTSGNTNGPAMAIGWRGAELILEDAITA